MSDINQDDIDKMLEDALVGDDHDASPAAGTAVDLDTAVLGNMSGMNGLASQDDIDALFAAVNHDPKPPLAAKSSDLELPIFEPGTDVVDTDANSVADQDDIDALFAAVDVDVDSRDAITPAEEPPEASTLDAPGASSLSFADAAAHESAIITHDWANDSDIEALFAADAEKNAAEPKAEAQEIQAAEADTKHLLSLDHSFLESELASAEAAVEEEMASESEELDALLSSIVEGSPVLPPEVEDTPESDTGDISGDDDDMIDMEALLREVAQAAPPAPPPKPAAALTDTTILSPDISAALAQAEVSQLSPIVDSATTMPPLVVPAAAGDGAAKAKGQRLEFSVLYGAGEVEAITGQISALLTTMAEKAQGYMQAWIAANSEAKELRSRALAEEQKRTSLESEKQAFTQQMADLRLRLGDIESGKIASEEAKRTLETTCQARIREQESRIDSLMAETGSLKDELTRARNQANGVDIESRRARFEAERLKNEIESERMERLRIQRALDNREKEIQALQTQSSGQASSLFIDELHRLVRRLESELDVRTSGAHAALKQLDQLELSDDMVPIVANLRVNLMQTLGQDADADDALKSLGREAMGIRGVGAIAPQKVEVLSFESALSVYNLASAVDIAGTLLRAATATPAQLMRKIYQCPALRRAEVVDYVEDLARLLEGLRTVQESNDRSRGTESAESEVFYVHMFDFLHNLVRLKLISRLSGDIWRVFLDLRGRFSFVTSDKQWAEYRDSVLRNHPGRQ